MAGKSLSRKALSPSGNATVTITASTMYSGILRSTRHSIRVIMQEL